VAPAQDGHSERFVETAGGKVNHENSMTCIRLMGQEVLPALREIGKGLGLESPFEKNTPVSLAYTPASERIASTSAAAGS
jgi:hypothetical protein